MQKRFKFRDCTDFSRVHGDTCLCRRFKNWRCKTDLGELSVSGFVRAKYQDKAGLIMIIKISFDAAKINLDYKSTKVFGHLECIVAINLINFVISHAS